MVISYAEFSYSLVQATPPLMLQDKGVTLQVCGLDQGQLRPAGAEPSVAAGMSVYIWSAPLIVNKSTGIKF